MWPPVLIALGVTGAGRDHAVTWPVTATAALALLSYLALWRVLRAGRFVADWVTLARFLVAAGCAVGAAWTGGVSWVLWTGLLVAVCGDLVDGYCARRYGGSDAGAALDMEADQFATLLLAVLGVRFAGLGGWLLLLPGLRSGYVLWMHGRGGPAHDPKPLDGDNRRARLICAVMLALQLAILLPCLPLVVRRAAAGVAVALLAYSFGSDVWQLRRRAGRQATAR